jgi:hypothetical protein
MVLLSIFAFSIPAVSETSGDGGICRVIVDDLQSNLTSKSGLTDLPFLRVGGYHDNLISVSPPEWGAQGFSLSPPIPAEATLEDLRGRGASSELLTSLTAMRHPPTWPGGVYTLFILKMGDMWIIEHPDWTACHSYNPVLVPPVDAPSEIVIPFKAEPDNMCTPWLVGGQVGGNPAVIVVHEEPFGGDVSKSEMLVATLSDHQIDGPCRIEATFEFALSKTNTLISGDWAANAADADNLAETALQLASRRDAGESAESLGEGVIPADSGIFSKQYQRMEELVRQSRSSQFPTFGMSTGFVFTTYIDDIVFPVIVRPGTVLMVRLGHGIGGGRKTPGYLAGYFRLSGDELAPIASVLVYPDRIRMVSVAVK